MELEKLIPLVQISFALLSTGISLGKLHGTTLFHGIWELSDVELRVAEYIIKINLTIL